MRLGSNRGHLLSEHDIAFMGLTEVAQAIALRKLSSLEVTQTCLQRIAQWQPSRKAFIRIDEEAAVAAAPACTEALSCENSAVNSCARWAATG